MIKNIIFDLSEVIISGYHGIEKVVEQNTNIKAEEFSTRKEEVLDIFLEAMRGKYAEDEYIEALLRDTNWNLDKDTLKKLIRKNLNIEVEGTMQIIKKLQDKYNLILLSDHIKEWMEYIINNNKDIDIFKHKYFSYEYGMLKGDEGTFKNILEEEGILPSETVFIDDYKSNVEMANKAGIKGIVFQDATQLEHELRKLHII